MEAVADPDKPIEFDYEAEKAIFKKTFDVLQKALGDKSFAFRNKAGTELAAGFSIYHFEAVTIGLQGVINKLDSSNEVQMAQRLALISDFLSDAFFSQVGFVAWKGFASALLTANSVT